MTTQKTIKSQADVITVCQSRIKGIETHGPGAGTVACAGTAYTGPQLVAIYQKCIDTRLALEALRHQEEVALQAREAADATRKVVDPGLIQWATNTFGPQSQQAKDLGYVPRVVTPPNTQVKAAATVKAKATRVARHTTGKKAKKRITGATAVAPAPEPGTPPGTPGTSGTPKA